MSNLVNVGNADKKLLQLGYEQAQIQELTDEQKQELVVILQEEMKLSGQGVELRPVTIRINKDACKFMDPFDNVINELKGVIVYKHKARGYWAKGDGNIPECSSKDGARGTITETQEERRCSACKYNEWGTAKDDTGINTKGKACKEMRRLFIELDDYELPIMVTLPPTSINSLDNYISARMTKGIPDIFKETIITLRKEESHGFKYAVAEFSIGDNVAPAKIYELKNKRNLIKQAAEAEEITQEDYMNDDDEDFSGVSNQDADVNLDDVV